VLACNGFDVVDLGVMVPAHKILDSALDCDADLVGLSGLITPSLDEMCNVAAEMERRGMSLPLLIGGATTSKAHTAVKIDPAYNLGQAVYVPDASRAVGVASALLSDEQRPALVAEVAAEYRAIVARRASERRSSRRSSLAAARANRFTTDWGAYAPTTPPLLGLHTLGDYSLGDIAGYIDWTPLFRTWELKGTFPRIFEDPSVGEVARSLHRDAEAMLERIVSERWIRADAVVGLWPANAIGDDIAVYADEDRGEPLAMLHTLRQQMERDAAHPNLALADFVAPRDTGVADYVGAFAVTTGHLEQEHAEQFERDNDDYNAILFKALCDRLAEAFAERLHEWVRREAWAYAPAESFSPQELIAERYRGIRPAPGYGCQPDHTEKGTLFELLAAPARAGITLTDSFAMNPGSSVSGIYLAHPDARYFGVGHIGSDQLDDYVTRKGWSAAEGRRWLAPILDGDDAGELPAAA